MGGVEPVTLGAAVGARLPRRGVQYDEVAAPRSNVFEGVHVRLGWVDVTAADEDRLLGAAHGEPDPVELAGTLGAAAEADGVAARQDRGVLGQDRQWVLLRVPWRRTDVLGKFDIVTLRS